LTDEGQAWFEQWTAGKLRGERIFIRDDGQAWGTSHQARRITDACKAAKITPAVSFHDLRNTYGSLLAMRGVPLQVIAAALGHADTRMTERHYAHLRDSYVAQTIRANLPSFGGESGKKVKSIR
jgi:integrase